MDITYEDNLQNSSTDNINSSTVSNPQALSDKVQSIAQALYTEFENQRNLYGEDSIRNLISQLIYEKILVNYLNNF